MRTRSSAIALIAALALAPAAALAQSAPVGGPDAKGNAPVKHAHTVNDGSAKPAHNSFTEGQARQHIINSGYEGVSNLVKGEDGVWRGKATKAGVATDVALDFKGNVTEGGAGAGGSTTTSATQTRTSSSSHAAPSPAATPAPTPAARADHAATAEGTPPKVAQRTSAATPHKAMARKSESSRCKNPGPNGVACSGVDRNENGVSDKEDRAIKGGGKP